MRHLKKFNETINIEDLRDICLELEDINIRCSFIPSWNRRDGLIISICGKVIDGKKVDDYNYVYFSEIKDTLLRIKDYLGDKFIRFKYTTMFDDPLDYNIYLNEKTTTEDYIYSFEITFKDLKLPGAYKQIKKFNEAINNKNFFIDKSVYEGLDNILYDINDICLELEDVGYKVFAHKRNIDRYSLIINSPEKERLYLGEEKTPTIVKEVLRRLNTYMKSKGFKIVDYYNTFSFQIEIIFDRII